MHTEKWKRKALPAIKTASSTSQTLEQHSMPIVVQDVQDGKKAPGRVLTKALRSLSSSSLESTTPSLSRRSSSMRRLQKHSSGGSGSMMDRFHRKHSREPSDSPVPSDVPGSPLEQPLQSMEIIHHGRLKTDITLLKARSEYLVLTDQCLVKIGSVEAARGIFPQLGQAEAILNGGSPGPAMNIKSALGEVKLEIPLRSVVATFREEGSSPRFGVEVWWFSSWPKIAFCKASLFFSLPNERDEWLAVIQRACRARLRAAPIGSTIPENLRSRIKHIVESIEPMATDGDLQDLIFPVAKRMVGATSTRLDGSAEGQQVADLSSFYLVIGPCMCYFIEVLRADYSTAPGDLRVKVFTFGTVTLTRFRATVATREQRFVMTFRPPFGREVRLDLASAHYRRVIEALTKIDRILKPMWPQHLQQQIFDVRGLPPPLQLTSGNDLGGVERSLEAYCTAYNVQLPSWTIEWNTNPQPAFRLLTAEKPYLPLQLLAVFRALRYNSYFKAISFKDVDLSSLSERTDPAQYGDSVVTTSLGGWRVPDELHEILLQASVLTQEMHALMFASESIKSIDLSNVLGLGTQAGQPSRASADYGAMQKLTSQLISPMLMLIRRQLFQGHTISLAGNPLASSDVEELTNLIVYDHVYFKKINLAKCSMGDTGLTQLWAALPAQADCLEILDTSDNAGTVPTEVIIDTLSRFHLMRQLRIAGNIRLRHDECLFDPAAIHTWPLEELDLSGIALNDLTVDVLAHYLASLDSDGLQLLQLNRCGLTGSQIARLFRGMGQARRMTVHISASRLDDGIDDLCGAIACGYGPWSLFAQMIEFCHESSYVKLLRALTVNKTIECLSLAGSATPDAASDEACQAVANFFSNNNTIRFLDISGYDSKLDEGRLGRGFSTALRGLQHNTRIEHLRVRSQMLNINTGDLAQAISGNKTLHTLDCESNDFNLSNFLHLVKHLEDNHAIRYFSAFTQQDLERSIRKSMENAAAVTTVPSKRSSVLGRLRQEKPQTLPSSGSGLLGQLQSEWDTALDRLQRVLLRNQGVEDKDQGVEVEDSSQASLFDRPGVDVFSAAFGGLALREYEFRKAKCLRELVPSNDGELQAAGAAAEALDAMNSDAARVTRTDSTSSSNSDSIEGSCGSGVRTPPEIDSPEATEFPFETNSETIFDETTTAFEPLEAELHDDDLMMKIHRRIRGSAIIGRIEEESDGTGAEKERLA